MLCSTTLKSLQELDFLHEFNDVEFNFLVSDFGIFEGRGWNVRPESPQDVEAISIDFLNGDEAVLKQSLKAMLDQLIADGKALRKIDPEVSLICGFC